jgi:hypothetical protein
MIRVPGSTHASGALDGCRSHEKSSHFLQDADLRGPAILVRTCSAPPKSDSLSESFTGLCNRIVIPLLLIRTGCAGAADFVGMPGRRAFFMARGVRAIVPEAP